MPYTQSWSFTLQYQLAAFTVLQAPITEPGHAPHRTFRNSLNTPGLGTIINAVQTRQNLGASSPNQYGIQQNGALLSETNLPAAESLSELLPRPEPFPKSIHAAAPWSTTVFT